MTGRVGNTYWGRIWDKERTIHTLSHLTPTSHPTPSLYELCPLGTLWKCTWVSHWGGRQSGIWRSIRVWVVCCPCLCRMQWWKGVGQTGHGMGKGGAEKQRWGEVRVNIWNKICPHQTLALLSSLWHCQWKMAELPPLHVWDREAWHVAWACLHVGHLSLLLGICAWLPFQGPCFWGDLLGMFGGSGGREGHMHHIKPSYTLWIHHPWGPSLQ